MPGIRSLSPQKWGAGIHYTLKILDFRVRGNAAKRSDDKDLKF